MTKLAKKTTVSAVVCAYNEERYIKKVIQGLVDSRLFNRIICVNDGSTDNTEKILKGFGNKIELISFPENKGKSYAMVAGVRTAKSEIIFFCDGDLVAFKKSHLQAAITPLQTGIADQVLLFREKEPMLLKKFTGERAYRRTDLLPYLKRLEKTKYGAETFLNNLFKSKRTFWFMQPGLCQAGKSGKLTSRRGLIKEVLYADEYLKEGYEMLAEAFRQKTPAVKKEIRRVFRQIRQNYQLRRKLFREILTEKDIREIKQADIKKIFKP
ncbi:MAG: glycosyltransferase family 2 protein [Candidatus Pacebacteria bacterium]|nr:glycosyltransferase family 2 protein [Candidatus Paceibacterota bacterium]